MSKIEIFASGTPATGFTDEVLKENIRRLFPGASQEQLARFTAGKQFVVTHVETTEAAARVLTALRKAGVQCFSGDSFASPGLEGITLSPATSQGNTQAAGTVPPGLQNTQARRKPARPTVPDNRIGDYLFLSLLPGEEVEYVGKVSLWALAPLIILGCVLAPIVIGLLFLLMAYISYTSTELAVTNKRIIAKFGFIKRATVEINISKIESIQVHQGILGRIFDFGSIIVTGTGSAHAPIPNISQPMEFRRAFMEALDAAVS